MVIQFQDGFKWRGNENYNPFSNEKLKQERMAICASCPSYIAFTKQCKKCGCFMELKTRMKDAKCPIDKW
tara:strand:+ start:803 stop:1012 length:210 start_codon:yes stop_codon:yes gene_type:complete